LALALAKELSGEAALERAQHQANESHCAGTGTAAASVTPGGYGRAEAGKLYVAVTEQRFHGVRRCC
jgi:hypothetical protein